MPNRQNPIVLAAMVIADGAWLFTALAVIGFFTNQDGSPLPWFAVFALLAFGAAVAKIAPLFALSGHSPAIVQAGVGIVAIYLALSAGTWAARDGFYLAWGLQTVQGDYSPVAVLGSLIALFAGAYIWRHAAVVATSTTPEYRLLRSFRVGIVVLAIALLVEQTTGRGLGATEMLVPFFAASLAGLAIARLPQRSGIRNAWTRVIAATVVAVVTLGLALGAMAGMFAQGSVNLIVQGWSYISGALLWIARLILEPLVKGMVAFIEWLRDRLAGPSPGSEPPRPRRPAWDWLDIEAGEPLADRIVEFLQVPMILLLLAVFCWILVRAYRGHATGRAPQMTEERESIEVDAPAELAQLIWDLLPDWIKRLRGDKTALRYPRDEAGITEVFLLYFDTITLAAKRGLDFDPGQTPTERIPHLRTALPGLAVERITALFNAACYGRKRAAAGAVEPLRRQLDALSAEPE
ncbi:MAG: DUF4129 domain-containing protein [Alphaproteobacteria bacterium]|nr:DUF4129 domain-containing protein [Alphaproteobacteria bacterium]